MSLCCSIKYKSSHHSPESDDEEVLIQREICSRQMCYSEQSVHRAGKRETGKERLGLLTPTEELESEQSEVEQKVSVSTSKRVSFEGGKVVGSGSIEDGVMEMDNEEEEEISDADGGDEEGSVESDEDNEQEKQDNGSDEELETAGSEENNQIESGQERQSGSEEEEEEQVEANEEKEKLVEPNEEKQVESEEEQSQQADEEQEQEPGSGSGSDDERPQNLQEQEEAEADDQQNSDSDSSLIQRQIQEEADMVEMVKNWQLGLSRVSPPVSSADLEFKLAMENLAREIGGGTKLPPSDFLPLINNLTCTLQPSSVHPNLPQLLQLLTSLLSHSSHFRVSMALLNCMSTLSSCVSFPSLAHFDLRPLLQKLCSLAGAQTRSSLKMEAGFALGQFIRGFGPNNVVAGFGCIALDKRIGFRVRATAVDGLCLCLLIFPSGDFDLGKMGAMLCSALTSPQRLLRQASLESLSVLAHILGPSVALPLFRSLLNSDRASSAVSARVSRRVLPMPGSNLLEYALVLAPSTQEYSDDLSPILTGRQVGQAGPDVSWILAGSGPVKSRVYLQTAVGSGSVFGERECTAHQLKSPQDEHKGFGKASKSTKQNGPPAAFKVSTMTTNSTHSMSTTSTTHGKHNQQRVSVSVDSEEPYVWKNTSSIQNSVSSKDALRPYLDPEPRKDYDYLTDQLHHETEKLYTVNPMFEPSGSVLQPLRDKYLRSRKNVSETSASDESSKSSAGSSATRDSGLGSLRNDEKMAGVSPLPDISTRRPSRVKNSPPMSLRSWQSSPNVVDEPRSAFDVQIQQEPKSPISTPSLVSTNSDSSVLRKPVLARPIPTTRRAPMDVEPPVEPVRVKSRRALTTHNSDDEEKEQQETREVIKSPGEVRKLVAVPKKSYKGYREKPVVDKSVFPLDLKPIDSPKSGLTQALAKLNASDWETNVDGFRLLVRLVRHHPDSIRPDLHIINLTGTKHLSNLRSQVSRSACLFFKEMFEMFGKLMEQDMDKIAACLLDKSADTNKFIREDAAAALQAMVQNMSPNKTLIALDSYGTKHRNALVRSTTALMTSHVVLKVGPDKAFGDLGDKLLPMLVVFLQEGSLETRTHAKTALCALAGHRNFESQLRRHVPAEALRHVTKAIVAIKNEVSGRRV